LNPPKYRIENLPSLTVISVHERKADRSYDKT